MKTMLSLVELAALTGTTREDLATEIGADALLRQPHRPPAVPAHVARQVLESRGHAFAPTVIAHMNLKGGIGKTTCTISTAARAAQYGYRTCVLDLDPQASATLAFDRVPEPEDPLFIDVWKEPRKMVEVAIREVHDGLWLLPSALENGLLDSSLANPRSQKHAVRKVCDELSRLGFDLILIDCPPSMSTASISSVCATDIVVVPVGCDAYSMRGLELTLSEIDSICDTYNVPVPRARILLSRYDGRERTARETNAILSERYSEALASAPIRVSTRFAQALQHRQTVFGEYRSSTAKTDYDRYIRDTLGINFE